LKIQCSNRLFLTHQLVDFVKIYYNFHCFEEPLRNLIPMETSMIQPGFFDLQDRLHKIDKNGDPLTKINETVEWELMSVVNSGHQNEYQAASFCS